VQTDDWTEVWLKPMSDGSYVAALFNRGLPERPVAFDLRKAGLEGSWSVRDLWRQQHEGVVCGRYSVSVPGHATHLVRLCRVKTDAVCLDPGWTFVRDGKRETVNLPHDAAIGHDFDTKRHPSRCGARLLDASRRAVRPDVELSCRRYEGRRGGPRLSASGENEVGE